MAEELMDAFGFGQASARFAINIYRCRAVLGGAECEDGHLFFDICRCEECDENVQNNYFPTLLCSLCGEYFDAYYEWSDDEDEV
jgi:hypothetical protein